VTAASVPPESQERGSPAQAGFLSGRERGAIGPAARGRSARLPAEARHGNTLETSLGCITSFQLRGHRGQSRHRDARHGLAGLLGHGDMGRDTRRANSSGPDGLITRRRVRHTCAHVRNLARTLTWPSPEEPGRQRAMQRQERYWHQGGHGLEHGGLLRSSNNRQHGTGGSARKKRSKCSALRTHVKQKDQEKSGLCYIHIQSILHKL
jgi:hypothetical protein